MCNPVAYAVFQVASAVNDYNNAKNTAKSVNANSEATATRIRNEAIYSDNSLIRKKERETEKTSLQKFQTLLGDIERQRGFAFTTIDSNYENYVRSIDENREAQNRNYSNQILALPRAVRPSFLPYALKAAGNIALASYNPAPDTQFNASTGANLDNYYNILPKQ